MLSYIRHVVLNCLGNLQSAFTLQRNRLQLSERWISSRMSLIKHYCWGGVLLLVPWTAFLYLYSLSEIKGQAGKNKLYCPPGDIDHCRLGGNGWWPCCVHILPENIPPFLFLSISPVVFLSCSPLSRCPAIKAAVQEISACVVGLHLAPWNGSSNDKHEAMYPLWCENLCRTGILTMPKI